MKRIITAVFLLACLLVGGLLTAGEDAGLAGAAYLRPQNLPDGTTTSPSIGFASNKDCGLYYSADTIPITINGTTIAAFASYGIVSGKVTDLGRPVLINTAPGATTPTFKFTSDNTGIGRNSIGQPSMVASGTEAQRWTDRQIYEPLINTGGIFISHTSIKGYKLTTDATAARLTVDGAADSASNRWSIASGTTITGQVYVSGIATDTTRASVGYIIGFKAQRVNSTVTVATCSTEIMEDASLTGCSAEVLADSTNGTFYVSVIGSTTTNIRWGAVAKYMEVNQP